MTYQVVNVQQEKKIRFETPTLRSDLCDYSDAYIVLKVHKCYMY